MNQSTIFCSICTRFLDKTIESLKSKANDLEIDVHELQRVVLGLHRDRDDLQKLQSESSQCLDKLESEVKQIIINLGTTPTYKLKGVFHCQCGTTGYVAVKVKCTYCGKEAYFGWSPCGHGGLDAHYLPG